MNSLVIFSAPVKGGVDGIEVFLIHFFYCPSQALAKALVMDNFPLPQKADNVVYVRVIAETQNVVVGGSGLLFCSHIFRKVCNDVDLYGHAGGAPGEAGGGGGVDSGGAVHEVGIEAGGLDLVLRQVSGQLVDDSSNHFQMS